MQAINNLMYENREKNISNKKELAAEGDGQKQDPNKAVISTPGHDINDVTVTESDSDSSMDHIQELNKQVTFQAMAKAQSTRKLNVANDGAKVSAKVVVDTNKETGIVSVDPENHTDEVAPQPFSLPQMEVESCLLKQVLHACMLF